MGCFKLDVLEENTPQFLRVGEINRVEEIGLGFNHLGNVLAVTSDLKIIPTLNSTSYQSVTLAATDYYPFGIVLNMC
jgi:hypothetical protein